MVREIHLSSNGTTTHSTLGAGTISQFISRTNTVFGMGLDLAAFLSVYGAVIGGDLTSWSIGKKSSMLSQSDQR
jgi:hypothetical protein